MSSTDAALANGSPRPPLVPRRGLVGRIMDALYGYDIFLSYTRADDPGSRFASVLRARLSDDTEGRKPLRCFLDAGDMPHDETLRRSIVERVRASRVLLVIAGPACTDHPWVCFEVEAALEYNRRIMLLDRGIGWPSCQGRLKSLLPEHVHIECEGKAPDSVPSDADESHIREQIGVRRVETTRRRVWRTVFCILTAMLIVVSALLVRQSALVRAEREARTEAEGNFRLAKRIVDENFTMVEHDLKDVPGVGDYRRALLTKARDFYRAFIERRKSEELDIDYALAIFNVGLVDLELGRDAQPSFGDAWKYLKRAAEDRPNSVETKKLLLASGLNSALAMIKAGKHTQAEQMLRESLPLGSSLLRANPADSELEIHYWLIHFALGRALAEQSQTTEAQSVFEEALAGIKGLEKRLRQADDPNESMLRIVEGHVAGAQFNLGNTPTLPLARRLESAESAWRRYELLVAERPTDNRLLFRVAQSARLLAALKLESGDAGEAQIFAERSMLLHHALANHFTSNREYEAEFEQDLNFLQNDLTLWRQELWFHQAALEALENTRDLPIGTDAQRRAVAHRIALAHVQIATHILRNVITGTEPLPSVEDKATALSHLRAASEINATIRKEDPNPNASVIVMRVNLPMWMAFAR